MCVFCKKSSEDYFLETNAFAAIYNISPILPGHSLIIPKRHLESLFELNNKELAEFMMLGRDVARLLNFVFETDSFDWAIQEKEAAGQSVAHLHMHVVPRKLGDLANPGDWFQKIEENHITDIDTYKQFRLSEEQMRELTLRLRNAAQELFKEST